MQLTKLFKALASETRLRILRELLEKPHCQLDLQRCVRKDLSTISRHVKELEEAGLVEIRKIGKRTQVVVKNKKLVKRLLEVGKCLTK